MRAEQKGNIIPIFAGVAFVLLAFSQLIYNQQDFSYILLFAAYASVAVLLFMKNRTVVLSIPIAIIALINIRLLFYSLRYVKYSGIFVIIIKILDILAVLSLLLLVCFTLLDSLPQYQEKIKQLSFLPALINTLEKYKEKAIQFWYLPLCIIAVSSVLGLLCFGINSIYFLKTPLTIASFALISMWLAYPDGFPFEDYTNAENNRTGGQGQVNSTAYCDLLKHILLLLFTFGIYYLIWIYRATAYLNRVEDEPPRNPTNKLLLCMFVPFYSIYWVYKSAQRLDRLAASKGVASDLTTLCLILAIFVGIIPPILMQEKINTITNVENGTEPPQANNATAAKKIKIGVAEELKTYKELLDNGVITQEEFETKKKQLLEL